MEASRDCRYRRSYRLRKRVEFLRVQSGRRFETPRLMVLSVPAPGGVGRFGVTVSKRVGCAPKRNRVKRCLREIYRLHRERWPVDQDFVVVARAGATHATFQQLRDDLLRWASRQAAPRGGR